MKAQNELNNYVIDIDFYDNESIIRGFLLHSCLNRMGEFDFKRAFECLIMPINDKLIEHAQCDYDTFYNYHDDISCYMYSDYEKFTVQTDYFYIGIDDVKQAIAKMQYEKLKQVFDGMFDNLIDLKERIENLDNLTEEERVILFDEVIHAQHVSGDIFDDIDIESIKTDLDYELIEIMGINEQ
jgi:hypothetical protein